MLRRQRLEIVQDKRRAVVLRQAVDHLTNAGVHLVDDDPVVGDAVGIRRLRRFTHLDNLISSVRTPEVVGGDTGGDGERPGFHAGAAGELGKAARHPDQRFLKQIVGGRAVSDIAPEVTREQRRQSDTSASPNRTNEISTLFLPRFDREALA